MGGGEVGRLLTVDEVADALRLSPSAVYGLIHSDVLPATRIGRSIRVSRLGRTRCLHSRCTAGEKASAGEGFSVRLGPLGRCSEPRARAGGLPPYPFLLPP